jgi:predicted AAA+ superfamily ATPase
MIIPRRITQHLDRLGKYYPIISLTGPRQAGKTTLLKKLYPSYQYLSFENPDTRLAFQTDPKAFLSKYDNKVIFDEAQHVPELFSYLQGIVDEDRTPGRFILSGSQNFLLLKSITQSLAGRVGIARLLPLDFAEKKSANILDPAYLTELLNGGYPARMVLGEPTDLFYSNYLASYVQRDVSGLVSPANLSIFQRFLQICAGYAGQLVNYSQISIAIGVSVPTVKSWLSILEQSYLVFLLPPFYRNIPKRLVKTPKLYFYDTGLACYLLRIAEVDALDTYYQKGNLFENMIVADAVKSAHHLGKDPWFSFYRDKNGTEVDIVYDTPAKTILWEVKATETYRPQLAKNLHSVARNWEQPVEKRLIYNSDQEGELAGVNLYHWMRHEWDFL